MTHRQKIKSTLCTYANRYLKTEDTHERGMINREANLYLHRVCDKEEFSHLHLIYVRMIHPHNKIKPRNTNGEILEGRL